MTNIINKKAIKQIINEKEFRVSESFFEELEKKIISDLIEEPIARAKGNSRKTIFHYDL